MLDSLYLDTANILAIKTKIKNTVLENNTYLWGGYLRDLCFGIPPTDIDIFIILDENYNNSYVELLSNIFNIPISTIHKTSPITVQFMFNNIMIDVRITIANPNETTHAILTRNVNTSDFTINSLCKNISSGEIIDITGNSLIDIKENRIRLVVDNIEHLFNSYPSRVFRLIRFSCMFNMKIPTNILLYIKENPHIINFIDRHQLINEYNKIKCSKNGNDGIDLLNLLNINPSNLDRSLIYFGTGWYEIEPGQIPNRILNSEKFKWSSESSELIISSKVKALKLKYIRHNKHIQNFSISYYVNDDISIIHNIESKIGDNTSIIDTCGANKICIDTSTFIPNDYENNNDLRTLGICLKTITAFTDDGIIEIPIEHIPYLI